MTAEELERLVATCAGADCPVLIALSVTGRVEIMPAEPFDQSVTDAFNAHQRRTTSAGKLLGPDAVGAAVDGFTRLGLEVLVRPSPWRLGPGHAALAAAWFTGWPAGACEQRPELRAHAPSYTRRHLTEAPAGHLSVTGTTRICWWSEYNSDVDGSPCPTPRRRGPAARPPDPQTPPSTARPRARCSPAVAEPLEGVDPRGGADSVSEP